MVYRPPETRHAPIHRFDCSARNPARLYRKPVHRANDRIWIGTGAAVTAEQALWSAIGETLERYSAMNCAEEELLEARGSELATAIDVANVIAYSDRQYASADFLFRPYDPSAMFYWKEGIDLITGSTIHAPYGLIYQSVFYKRPQERLIENVSTGLAAGPTFDRAITGALCEVLERDGFIGNWSIRRSPPRIRIDDELRKAVGPDVLPLLEVPGYELYLLNLTTDLEIPVIGAVLFETHRRVFAVGAACHPDPIVALRKAIVEAHHTNAWAIDMERRLFARGRGVSPVSRDSIKQFFEHVLFYRVPAQCEEADFFTAGAVANLGAHFPAHGAGGISPDGAWRQVAKAALQRGYRPAVFELTSADVGDLGFRVVRAVVPGLQPMYADMQYANEDTRRLHKLADYYRHAWDGQINVLPHPFP